MSIRALLFIAAGLVGCKPETPKQMASADPASEANWPAPPGWTQEAFALPPDFAPQMPYRGREELRFGPDFYSVASATYWSYDIVWWLDDQPAFDPPTLSSSLTMYFRGLAFEVGQGKYQFDSTSFRADLTSADSSGENPAISGQVHSYDPFTTGLPLVLNVEARFRSCPEAHRFAITLALSQKPFQDTVWSSLRTTLGAFACR